MSIRRPFISLALFAVTIASVESRSAQAGPLLDWLCGHHRATAPAYPVGAPVPVGTAGGTVANMPVTGYPATGIAPPSYGSGYAGYSVAMPVGSAPVTAVPIPGNTLAVNPTGGYALGGYPPAGFPASGYAANYGNYYGARMPVIGPSGYGYSAAQPNGITAATAPTIMSYVPDYRTTQYRAPVTYYRPMMTTDPNTGAQVVALAPCTSYEYQTQRVPTFGYNGVVGAYSTPPVVPAPPSMPTYTLPSGGVPIAAGGATSMLPPTGNSYAMGYGGVSGATQTYSSPTYSSPTYSSPAYGTPTIKSPTYSSNYGAYSPQQLGVPVQPGLIAPPMSNYATQPMSPPQGYYGSATGGSTGGGSTGSYRSPTYTPGLTAPQGPVQVPSLQPPAMQSPYPSNTYPAPGYQPSYQPTTPNYPITPPPSLSDPSGDVAPVLPPNLGASNERSQLRAIVRQPMSANNSMNNSFSDVNTQSSLNPLNSARTNQQAQQAPQTEPRRDTQSPTMDPIPAPANLDQQPRWNPGLLKDEDRTASRPVAPKDAQPSSPYAGQGKPIQWASFRSNDSDVASPVPSAAPSQENRTAAEPPQSSRNQLNFSMPTEQASAETALSNVVRSSPLSGLRPIASPPATQQAAPRTTSRQTGGWSVAK